MTDARQQKKVLDEMKKFQKRLEDSPEEAKAFLVKVGILTPKGNLRKPYR